MLCNEDNNPKSQKTHHIDMLNKIHPRVHIPHVSSSLFADVVDFLAICRLSGSKFRKYARILSKKPEFRLDESSGQPLKH